MNLHKITETKSTITLGWDPEQGAVMYRGTRKGYVNPDGTQRWSQAAADATAMKFSKDEWYRVEALSVLDHGTYPSTEPPPPPGDVFPSPGLYPSVEKPGA